MQTNLFQGPLPPPEPDKPSVQIDASWKEALGDAFETPYFKAIKAFLKQERAQGHLIYPPGPQIFYAFNSTPFDTVKVVILGQDPYHGHGQAHGLSFSVPDGIKPPPSLNNIFKEILSDVGATLTGTGNLIPWAEQGVFLLNAMLTVRAKTPASHQKIGWQEFTDTVIQTLSNQRDNLVFLLWGKFAQSKSELIDGNKHLILTAPHPSPYSASYGFFGCKHFSQTNAYLKKHGLSPIDWSV